MFSHILPCSAKYAVALLVMGATTALQAAPIVWETPTNTTGKADLIEGKVIIALNVGAESPTVTGGGASGTSTYAFAAADYSAASLLPHTFAATAGGPTARSRTSANVYTPSAMASTGDADFDTVIVSFADAWGSPGGISAGTLTLSGLTDGTDYGIQVFYNDQRNNQDDRVMTYGDGMGATVDLAGGDPADGVQTNVYGQFAAGSFTASGTTQDLTMLANAFGNVHFSALLIVGPPDANTPPSFSGRSLAVDDGSPIGTVVGTLSATDLDGPDPLEYTITGGNDGGAFSLGLLSGELTVAGTIDDDVQSSYVLTVEASDGLAATPASVSVDVLVGGRAVITWSEPQFTTGKADLIDGQAVLALCGGTLAPSIAGGGAGGSAAHLFQSANFSNIHFFGSGADSGDTPREGILDDVYAPSSMVSTGDAAFDDLIRSVTYANGTPSGIVNGYVLIPGLDPGARYQVQVFFNDQRDGQDHRVMAYGDGNGNTVDIAAGDAASGIQTNAYGQYAIGSFTAEAENQWLTMTAIGFGNVHFSAILVTTPFEITEYRLSDTEVALSWTSVGGQIYRVLAKESLETATGAWTVVGGDIAATPPTNSETVSVHSAGTTFYAVEALPVPPLFYDDFEQGEGAWTNGSDGAEGTIWSWGAPSNVGPATGANGSTNCFGTNLSGNYQGDANIWLRSPVIDLTTVASATLRFQHFIDIEVDWDVGSIRVLDASNQSELGVVAPILDGAATDWAPYAAPIPEAAVGQRVQLEFRLVSDGDFHFAGWYIDDVRVSEP